MKNLQTQVRISPCLGYFNRLLICLLTSSLSTLESDKNQSATLIIRQLHARLSKGLLSYEQWKANYNGIQSPYLLLLFNVNSVCNQAALSPAPIDDLFKLTSHPHFPVNANSSSQLAQLKSYCPFP